LIRREVGDRRGEGVALSNLGFLAEQQGRLAEAESYFRQSLAVYESIGAEKDVQDEIEALARTNAARAASMDNTDAPRDPVNLSGAASAPDIAGGIDAALPPVPADKVGTARQGGRRRWPWGRKPRTAGR
jgi:hypothetical protein